MIDKTESITDLVQDFGHKKITMEISKKKKVCSFMFVFFFVFFSRFFQFFQFYNKID